MRIAIIADDLTGANDSGMQFAAHGLPTTVHLGDPVGGLAEEGGVAVIDTETRGLAAGRVPPLVEAVARRVRAAGIARVYKKIDSTLRGHVGLELDAAARVLDADYVFLAPAFPAMKRTVEDGLLLVDGVPVDRTDIARDPGSPVTSAEIARLVAPHMPGAACLTVSTAEAANPEALRARLAAARAHGRVCAAFDARTDADLAAVAAFGAAMAEEDGAAILWAGSAGLAAQLPAAWGIPARPPAPPALPRAARPPLLAVGSVNPVSVAQTDHAIETTGATPAILSPEALLEEGGRDAEIARGILLLRDLARGGAEILILTTAHGRADVERTVALAGRLGLSRGEAGRRIAEGLAAVARRLLDDGLTDRLVTTGGDTARAIMDATGIAAMSVAGSIEPGIPLMRAHGTPERHIITKAGGFGAPDALLRAIAFLIEGEIAR
ncbi:four-carbon acid sugar kinase family protein [Oleispirillum naphthae]|uniref:four-carbon acid sugar kinase family protein n=1 Tax=Oleispirillum naphthae TaxID=2838853 RepID=UPI00308244A5